MMLNDDFQARKQEIWARLAAPVPAHAISWRQDGRPVQRDGRWIARFVAYIEANTARERLDAVVPGEWDLTLELLPPLPGGDDDAAGCAFKARLQVMGVIREDVGTGRDYKQAATDAFKRAAVRFGIAHELYAYESNWVAVDGDGRYVTPLEDPAAAYVRRYGAPPGASRTGTSAVGQREPDEAERPVSDEPGCPRCGGRMWDNRATKRNPRAPDYRCRTRGCEGVIWPARESTPAPAGSARSEERQLVAASEIPLAESEDEIPF